MPHLRQSSSQTDASTSSPSELQPPLLPLLPLLPSLLLLPLLPPLPSPQPLSLPVVSCQRESGAAAVYGALC